MNFIKHNKVLFGAFLLTFVLSLTMIVLDIYMYSQFDSTNEEVAEKLKKYTDLTKKTPAPTERNAKTLEYEHKFFQKRLMNLQRQFGKYLRKPFQEFCKSLNLTEDELTGMFKTYCDELPQERKMLFNCRTDAQNFIDFARSKLLPAVTEHMGEKKDAGKAKLVIQDALTNFEARIADLVPGRILPSKIDFATDKKVDDLARNLERTNGYEYLMEAMGLPRSVELDKFRSWIQSVQYAMRDRDVIPGLDKLEKLSEKNDCIVKLTFTDQVPDQSRIYHVVRQMQIRYDLFRRMKKFGVQRLEGFQCLSPLEGETVNGNFQRFIFQMNIYGELRNVRNLFNDLNNACRDNVYYKVLFVELERENPEDMEKLLQEQESERSLGKGEEREDRRNSGSQEEKSQTSPGVVIAVGKDRNVKVFLKLEILAFKGDQIERTAVEAR